jgi:medium-chain acyl-[acyl-carrier-protein] hydrolase
MAMMRKSPPDDAERWIERRVGRAPPQFRLFCFPYAGGGATIFRDWADELQLSVEVCAIQLPGREWRCSEPSLRRVDEVVANLLPVLKPYLDIPFAMFGHSMGALLAYEMARGILSTAGREPRVLFVSAHRAPHLSSRKRNLHGLPQDELIAEVKAFNGTPAEVFEHEDLVELVLPMLRNDLELVETYKAGPASVLSCPVVAIGGSRDPEILPEELAGWRSVTAGPFKSILLQGDHFFINSARGNLLRALQEELAALGLQ